MRACMRSACACEHERARENPQKETRASRAACARGDVLCTDSSSVLAIHVCGDRPGCVADDAYACYSPVSRRTYIHRVWVRACVFMGLYLARNPLL